jgi:hypothetical protein
MSCPVLRETIRRETAVEAKTRSAARNEIENRRAGHRSNELSRDVWYKLPRGETAACPQTNRNRVIQITSRDVADSIRHREHRKSESKSHAKQPDANVSIRIGGGVILILPVPVSSKSTRSTVA